MNAQAHLFIVLYKTVLTRLSVQHGLWLKGNWPFYLLRCILSCLGQMMCFQEVFWRVHEILVLIACVQKPPSDVSSQDINQILV